MLFGAGGGFIDKVFNFFILCSYVGGLQFVNQRGPSQQLC